MILIYTDELNPRIEYILKLIFTTILKNEIAITLKSSRFLRSKLPRLNYSYEKFGNEIYIKPHRLMHCKAHIQPDIQPVWYNGEKYFFESSADSVFPFDLFAASFYLVSRYEEYLEGEKDKHNRFQADECILQKYGLLKKPVVNIWARMLAEKLKEQFPQLQIPQPHFEFLSTIDIDNAWAFKHKGFFRSTGALAKAVSQGNFTEVNNRFRVWMGKEKDPYDTYSFLDEVFEGNEDKVRYFFLLGNYKRYDKNVSWKNRHYQQLIQTIASKYLTGIHPSWSSAKKKNYSLLASEIKRLEKITGKEVKSSRQHYIRIKFPRTYRKLLKAGILEDYSMGYPSHIGFRAGICTPFYFYDLKKETATSLLVVPFQVMDVTLHDYMGLAAKEAMIETEDLMLEVKKVGGTFCSIWHNETLNEESEWKHYREVFMKMNKLGFEWTNEKKTSDIPETQRN
jgi:hypothetical protein